MAARWPHGSGKKALTPPQPRSHFAFQASTFMAGEINVVEWSVSRSVLNGCCCNSLRLRAAPVYILPTGLDGSCPYTAVSCVPSLCWWFECCFPRNRGCWKWRQAAGHIKSSLRNGFLFLAPQGQGGQGQTTPASDDIELQQIERTAFRFLTPCFDSTFFAF